MPYKEYHSFSINNKKYKIYRWDKNKFEPGIDVLWGISGDKPEISSIRFNKDKFSISKAENWLKEHDFNAIDKEPAKKESCIISFKKFLYMI